MGQGHRSSRIVPHPHLLHFTPIVPPVRLTPLLCSQARHTSARASSVALLGAGGGSWTGCTSPAMIIACLSAWVLIYAAASVPVPPLLRDSWVDPNRLCEVPQAIALFSVSPRSLLPVQ